MKNRMTAWILGAVAVSLLVGGLVVFAGNGFGRGAGSGSQAACPGTCGQSTCAAALDADGDGTPNGQDSDWTAPCARTATGNALGYGMMGAGVPSRSASCPMAQSGAAGARGCGCPQGGGRFGGGNS